MKAAVIGTGWGQVHVDALRRDGVQVVSVAGSGRDGSRDWRELVRLPLDLVTIATPAATHAPLLAAFEHLPVICEKPVLGLAGNRSLLPVRRHDVWVNYAFAFLESARALANALPRIGAPQRVEVCSWHDLGLARFSDLDMLLEVSSHPLSFVVDLLGTPAAAGVVRSSASGSLALPLQVGGVPTEVHCRRQPGLGGLRHQVRMTGVDGVLELGGHWRNGSRWSFEPVLLDGAPVSAVEDPPEDCWHEANVRSIRTAVAVVRGDLAASDAVAAGLFSLERALPIDLVVRQACGATQVVGPGT